MKEWARREWRYSRREGLDYLSLEDSILSPRMKQRKKSTNKTLCTVRSPFMRPRLISTKA